METMETNEINVNKDSISIESLLKSSFKKILDNIVVCIANTLIAFLSTIFLCITVIGILALPAVWGGYTESMIRLSLGQKVEIGDFFRAGFDRWSTLLIGYVVACLGIAIGIVFFIIPGVYLMIRWYFMVQIIVNEDLGAMEALKKSGEMTSNIMWEVLAVFLVCMIIGAVGAAIPFSQIVTTPLVTIIAAKYYTSNLNIN